MHSTEPDAAQVKPALTDVFVETNAMAAAYKALAPLDEDARSRAMSWLQIRLRQESRYDEEPPF